MKKSIEPYWANGRRPIGPPEEIETVFLAKKGAGLRAYRRSYGSGPFAVIDRDAWYVAVWVKDKKLGSARKVYLPLVLIRK